MRRWMRRITGAVTGGLLVLAAASALAASAATSDQFAQVRGFKVEISGASGKEVDTAWETVSGGELVMEQVELEDGRTVGAGVVTEIVERNAVTGTGKDGKPEVLQNGAGSFKVDIEGMPQTSANVTEVTIDDLQIDVRETTTGLDVEYRTYAPGAAHWGQAKITARSRNRKDMLQWYQDTVKGKNIRKNITITLLTKAGNTARTYTLMECIPTRYRPFVLDSLGNAPAEQVTVSCSGVTFDWAKRKAMSDWLNETVSGKPWKRTLTITEILKDGSSGRSFTYLDAFPVRYVFPSLSVSATGTIMEEVRIKPIRCELK